MSTRARWADGATPVVDPKEATKYLTMGQVSDQTGLSQKTLQDSLTRDEITNPRNPRGALCRPLRRWGNLPLWEPEQVQRYQEMVALLEDADEVELPSYGPTEARQEDLVTTKEIAERLGVCDQTIRRWQRNDGEFPVAVGKLRRYGEPGVPDHLRPWSEVVKWVRNRPKLRIPADRRAALSTAS